MCRGRTVGRPLLLRTPGKTGDRPLPLSWGSSSQTLAHSTATGVVRNLAVIILAAILRRTGERSQDVAKNCRGMSRGEG